MKRTVLVIVVVVSMFLVFLLLPLILKKRNPSLTVGPDLSELEYSEILFENTQARIQLAGMLFLPDGDGPFPTAVIIHGSGPSKRNRTWYLSVAQYLQRNGIAVVLPDKRGCEKSSGDWVGAGLQELATDTLSAVEFVKDQLIFECSTIGIIGFSQGGWIAPIAAVESEDVSFVVSMSGSALTTDETLIYNETNVIAKYTYPFIAKILAPIDAKNLKKKEHLSAFYPFDPIPYWKEVRAPVFFAFGENDTAVPVEQCIDRLRENNLKQFRVKVYPDGGHGITDPRTHKVNEEYLHDLFEFIDETTK